MNNRVTLHLVCVLLVLGILLPQATAALAGLGFADGRVMIICSGDGLRKVRVDENGEPVEISRDAERCALVHATDTAAVPVCQRGVCGAVDEVAPALTANLVPLGPACFASLPRGPPLC